jgi:predicted nucleic acid-binding protein
VFLDTNVIVYAADRNDGVRREQAQSLIRGLQRESTFTSQQVLSEYANVLVHPNKLALTARRGIESVRLMAEEWSVLPVTPAAVIAALEATDRWGLHYYDAQIWATAALNRVPIVLSEDFGHGLKLGPVLFLDPFAKDFDFKALES